jgi:hypothetical protein
MYKRLGGMLAFSGTTGVRLAGRRTSVCFIDFAEGSHLAYGDQRKFGRIGLTDDPADLLRARRRGVLGIVTMFSYCCSIPDRAMPYIADCWRAHDDEERRRVQ